MFSEQFLEVRIHQCKCLDKLNKLSLTVKQFFLCFLEKWVSYELLFYKHNKLDKCILNSNYQSVFNNINVTEAYEVWNERFKFG